MNASAVGNLEKTRSSPAFQFQALAALPCGCVAAAYRSWHWGVAMVSLEAKGPHCVLNGHDVGRVLELNDLFEVSQSDEVAFG